jgi:hypothetical protein
MAGAGTADEHAVEHSACAACSSSAAPCQTPERSGSFFDCSAAHA